ncbi:MAG TPA: response regulator, partial [Bacteroidia bacterium]|nr:response regulator [Bacteroidia bacterium]
IDDDALVIRSLSQHLTDAGHTVATAKDGSEADDYIENVKTSPDLIICDLLMPGISGLTFISLLRNFHNYSIPVIVISSLNRADLLSAQAGITDLDFIPKPVNIDLLLEKINKYNLKTIQL